MTLGSIEKKCSRLLRHLRGSRTGLETLRRLSMVSGIRRLVRVLFVLLVSLFLVLGLTSSYSHFFSSDWIKRSAGRVSEDGVGLDVAFAVVDRKLGCWLPVLGRAGDDRRLIGHWDVYCGVSAELALEAWQGVLGLAKGRRNQASNGEQRALNNWE